MSVWHRYNSKILDLQRRIQLPIADRHQWACLNRRAAEIGTLPEAIPI